MRDRIFTCQRLLTLVVLAAVAAVGAAPASAGLINLSVSGDDFTAEIDLAGAIDGDLEVSFEDSTNLSTSTLGASVSLLGVLDLLDVASRLPTTSIAVPTAFPVMLTIEPSTSSGLSFEGVVDIEIYTNDLTYVLGSKLRLFAAPLNGDFVDITQSIAGGSYRVRGSKGEFSEFVIVTDLRSIDTVIDEKLDRLEDALSEFESDIDSTVYATLEDYLDDVETEYDGEDEEAAIDALDDFIDTVESNSGTNIPDEWRAARDLDNVAGILRSIAGTLRFSLEIKAAS
jgi:Family of unknown function (DUF6689)